MRTGLDAALLVFRGWAESKSVVRVELHVGLCAAALSARVVAVSDDELRMLSDDGASDFVLRLLPSFTFSFTDIRDLQGDPKIFEQMVIVFFGTSHDSNDDHIALAVEGAHHEK